MVLGDMPVAFGHFAHMAMFNAKEEQNNIN
jgi:hypothetical protein